MIKPVEEDALNMSSKLYLKCPKCGFEDTLVKIPPIDVNNQSEVDDLKDFTCPECNALVWEENYLATQSKETINKRVDELRCIDCERNGFDSIQKRDDLRGLFICRKRPTHTTKIKPEHN